METICKSQAMKRLLIRVTFKKLTGKSKSFISVGVQSPTEINVPRGCAVILIGICRFADQNHAPSLTDVRLEIGKENNMEQIQAKKVLRWLNIL